MPHLRFIRDKRGYENTYVVDSVRRRGKVRQRILYWFRTPPNIRVGRAALDETAIRAIEEGNPEIEFDWSKILEAQPQPAPVDTPERHRRPRDRQAQGRPPRPPQSDAGPPPASEIPALVEPAPLDVIEPAERPFYAEPSLQAEPSAEPLPLDAESPFDARPVAESLAPDGSLSDLHENGDILHENGHIEPPVLVPVTVYHGGADVYVADVPDVPRQSPVEAQLGSEQLGRVRARYAEILARITERVSGDPARLEEMRRAADALNPDGWVTEAEITAGLQQFDARLGEIRRTLGIKRRRRSRRGGRRRHKSDDGSGPVAAGIQPAGSVDSPNESEDLPDDPLQEPGQDDDE